MKVAVGFSTTKRKAAPAAGAATALAATAIEYGGRALQQKRKSDTQRAICVPPALAAEIQSNFL